MRQAEDHNPHTRAAQILEMLHMYKLIETAWMEEDGFVVDGGGQRYLTSEQVCDEYGGKIAAMAESIASETPDEELITTTVSVAVGAPGPVPYVENFDARDRVYRDHWPTA
ncbi:hypothetical protein AB0I72_22905 [Nocardiopsis sp. NPDC049922]|uniref:hypothetical protein n=1 Tax=Nocardiopsis sp. NPDC049922 TaxID=3155157 RepID=UPI0033CBA2DD